MEPLVYLKFQLTWMSLNLTILTTHSFLLALGSAFSSLISHLCPPELASSGCLGVTSFVWGMACQLSARVWYLGTA